VRHSFGLFLLPEPLLSKEDMLLSISGFREFHASGREGRFSKRLVNLMLKRFRNGSFDVTSEFREMCGAERTSDITATEAGLKRLSDDLEILSSTFLDIKKLSGIKNVLLFQGAEDRIVWPERAEDLHRSIPGSRLVMIEGAGHGLPFTHSDLCIRLLMEHLHLYHEKIVTL
jgi:pimeloyl-ACP methyl ester carboxylesterase